MIRLTGRILLMMPALVCTVYAHAVEFDARVKLFGTGAALPHSDVQRLQAGTPLYDYTADARLMFSQQSGGLTWISHHATILNGGDSYGFLLNGGAVLDQSVTDDDRRLVDLTWRLDSGSRHQLQHRFDRLAVQYNGASWGLTLGRQAVSWGNGLVFQPMDIFSPFAPTTVDRDYKAGDDLILLDKLFENGSDLQLLIVGRRDADNDVSRHSSSAAVKWHTFVGNGELELVGGKHYEDDVYGLSWRVPVGGALLRNDIIATRLDDGDWKVSGVLNLDYSFMLVGRNAYVSAEYYHNDFGVKSLPSTPLLLPEALTVRLARGEVFNLMRDYLALSGTLEWHALWNQSITLITNLKDSSSLIQSQLTYDLNDHSRVNAGVVIPIGSAGEEFGGVPLAGDALTSGGATQGYLRWVYYF